PVRGHPGPPAGPRLGSRIRRLRTLERPPAGRRPHDRTAPPRRRPQARLPLSRTFTLLVGGPEKGNAAGPASRRVLGECYLARLKILLPSHTRGSYLRSTTRSFIGISALSVILMCSGQTSVQHLVMLQ